jgi:hypothetical protein
VFELTGEAAIVTIDEAFWPRNGRRPAALAESVPTA